jgi:hypothetical protein
MVQARVYCDKPAAVQLEEVGCTAKSDDKVIVTTTTSEEEIVSVMYWDCFTTYHMRFESKHVNALVGDYPASMRTHLQLHQGAERGHFLHPHRPVNGSGRLEFLR